MAAIDKTAPTPVPGRAREGNRGKWIAVRGGKVVASAYNLSELAADKRVKELDAMYRVPTTSTYFY